MIKIINVYNGPIGSSGQGGGVKYIENLVKLQKKYYSKIYLLSLGKGKKKLVNINGVNVIFFPIGQSHNWIFFCIKLFIFLIKNKKEFSNSVFHIHRIYFAPFIRIIKVRKIVATIHTKTFDVFRLKYPFLKFLIYFFIKIERKIINSFVNDLSFAGDYSRDLYKKRHKNLRKKLWHLPPPFNFKRARKSNFFKKEKKKIILVVGRIALVKRPLLVAKLFLYALKKDPYVAKNFKLCFAGTGESLNDLNKFINNNNLNKFILPVKKINNSLMPQLYKGSHAVLFLSQSEVNPFVIKEALSSGKPIFTTNVGTAKNLITKKNGIIIPINNPLKNLDLFITFLKKKYNSKDIINSSLNFINNDNKIFNENIKKIYK